MSQESISWGELAQLTHATQVEKFNWCGCEDNEGKENPFSDCPKPESELCPACELINPFCICEKESEQ